MKKFILPLGLISLVVLASLLFISSVDRPEESKIHDPYEKVRFNNYRIFSVPVPEQQDFAGEEVPLDLFYVREGLDKELLVNTYWHSHTLLLFKRAYRYFPEIEKILKEENVPEDFKYLALIESGLENVVSPAGAAGFWQFMKRTGADYGLEVNKYVDERYNLPKSTRAACKYLKKAKKDFGSWTLAAASYNMGMGGLRRDMKNQGVNNYYDLHLNRETARYIYRILALKTIYENPVAYGFFLRETDMYPPLEYSTIAVDTTIASLPDFANARDLNYHVLREYNPWLRSYTLPNTGRKEYKIRIPDKEQLKHSKLMEDITFDGVFFNDTIQLDQIR